MDHTKRKKGVQNKYQEKYGSCVSVCLRETEREGAGEEGESRGESLFKYFTNLPTVFEREVEDGIEGEREMEG